jgi:hypothetical protein
MKSLQMSLMVVVFAILLAPVALAQQYQILRAEYGADSRWVDVTQRLKSIASSNTSFRMGNSTFGVDPAPGVVKMLRITARSLQGGGNRTFEYREGSTVDGAQFSGWNGGNWGDGNSGNWGGGNGGNVGWGEYRILRAEYGADNRWADVTQQLRRIASSDATFRMGNSTFGIDPAPGVVKTLRIVARSPGERDRTFEYREGSTVDGAQFSGWNGGNWGDGNGGNWGGGNGGNGGNVGWGEYRILRAEYGADNRWADVTQQLRRIASSDATFRMGNSTFGIDPAPGVIKTLRIMARRPGERNRTFEYREGSTVDGAQFSGWNRGDWGYGDGDRDNSNYNNRGDLRIIQASYGAGNRNVDVTRQLQGLADRGSLRISISNDSMGVGDPAPGIRKELRVVYQYRGRQQRATVRENDTLNIPD